MHFLFKTVDAFCDFWRIANRPYSIELFGVELHEYPCPLAGTPIVRIRPDSGATIDATTLGDADLDDDCSPRGCVVVESCDSPPIVKRRTFSRRGAHFKRQYPFTPRSTVSTSSPLPRPLLKEREQSHKQENGYDCFKTRPR
jgi:hypothetical protein